MKLKTPLEPFGIAMNVILISKTMLLERKRYFYVDKTIYFSKSVAMYDVVGLVINILGFDYFIENCFH